MNERDVMNVRARIENEFDIPKFENKVAVYYIHFKVNMNMSFIFIYN